MLASHRNYISSTNEDLERAAGVMKTASKITEDADMRNMYIGAAAALYAMANYEMKDENDFKTIWAMLVTNI